MLKIVSVVSADAKKTKSNLLEVGGASEPHMKLETPNFAKHDFEDILDEVKTKDRPA